MSAKEDINYSKVIEEWTVFEKTKENYEALIKKMVRESLEATNKRKALEEKVTELEEDIDFLMTFGSFDFGFDTDQYDQHYDDIYKRWQNSETN